MDWHTRTAERESVSVIQSFFVVNPLPDHFSFKDKFSVREPVRAL